MQFQEMEELYGKQIASTYFNRKYYKSKDEFDLCGPLINSLIEAFLFRDYSSVDSLLFPTEPTILDIPYVLLSDERKEEYLKKVKDIIDNRFVYTNSIRIPLLVFIANNENIDEKQIENIALSFQSDAEFDDFKLYSIMQKTKKSFNKYDSYINAISDKRKQNEYSNMIDIFQNREYKLMTDVLYRNKNNEINEKFNVTLLQNKFYMPDLKGELTFDQWQYVHEVTDFAIKQSLLDDFNRYLDSLANKKDSSTSLKERIEILKQKINESMHGE